MNDKIKNQILQTGEWWTDKWWQKKGHRGFSVFSDDKVEEIMQILIKEFDAKWFLKNCPEHHLALTLHMRGTLFLLPLLYLGNDLKIINSKKHLIGNIKKRLKIPEEYFGAKFELSLLAHLIRNNINIEPNYKTGNGNKDCDFKITSNKETLYLELKNIKNPQLNMERQNMLFHLYGDIAKEVPIDFDFKFTNRYRKIYHTKEGFENFKNNYNEIKEHIVNHMKNSMKDDYYSLHEIDDFAFYCLKYNQHTGHCDFEIDYCSSSKEYEKFQTTIEEAAGQLAEPGILIINFSKTPKHETCISIYKLLENNKEKFNHVSNIIIAYETSQHNPKSEKIYGIREIINPNAEDVSNYELYNTMMELFIKKQSQINGK